MSAPPPTTPTDAATVFGLVGGGHEHDGLATHYAMHVALQTMKERCQSLQQKLSIVEDENQTLRKSAGLDRHQHQLLPPHPNEIEMLQDKIGELTRQKFQLTEHITMVSTENRQLWSRLSKLTKDNAQLDTSLSLAKLKDTAAAAAATTSTTGQNLIRSKTFTQNAPNPILRMRMTAAATGGGTNDTNQMSLEEISLKILNEFLEGKAEVERKCADILGDDTTAATTTPAHNSFGFGYLNDEPLNENELQSDIRKCSDGMVDIRRELLRQQSDIKVALSNLRQRKILEVCKSCKLKAANKTTTEDKKMETDDIISNRYSDKSLLMFGGGGGGGSDGGGSNAVPQLPGKPEPTTTVHIDFLEQKRKADGMDKLCPMCARVYSSSSTFDDFQEHVESHFIDDSELDVSIDRNFEIISHQVGNF